MSIYSNNSVSCRGCQRQLTLIYRELTLLNEHFCELHSLVVQAANKQKTVLRDARYVMDRIGVSKRTLLRFQQCGDLPVFERKGGKRYYLDDKVEWIYRKYRGNS